MEYDNNRTESRLKGSLSEKKYMENSTETNGNIDNNTTFSYENNLFEQPTTFAVPEKKIMAENFSTGNVSESTPIFGEDTTPPMFGATTDSISGTASDPMPRPLPDMTPRSEMPRMSTASMPTHPTYHSIPLGEDRDNTSKRKNVNIYIGIVTSISIIFLFIAIIAVVWMQAIGSEINSGSFLENIGRSLSQYDSFLSFCDVASKLLFGAYILAVGNFISIILASKYDRHKIGWGVFGIIASIIYIIAISSINDAVSNSLRARDIIDSFFLNIWNLK